MGEIFDHLCHVNAVVNTPFAVSPSPLATRGHNRPWRVVLIHYGVGGVKYLHERTQSRKSENVRKTVQADVYELVGEKSSENGASRSVRARITDGVPKKSLATEVRYVL